MRRWMWIALVLLGVARPGIAETIRLTEEEREFMRPAHEVFLRCKSAINGLAAIPGSKEKTEAVWREQCRDPLVEIEQALFGECLKQREDDKRWGPTTQGAIRLFGSCYSDDFLRPYSMMEAFHNEARNGLERLQKAIAQAEKAEAVRKKAQEEMLEKQRDEKWRAGLRVGQIVAVNKAGNQQGKAIQIRGDNVLVESEGDVCTIMHTEHNIGPYRTQWTSCEEYAHRVWRNWHPRSELYRPR